MNAVLQLSLRHARAIWSLRQSDVDWDDRRSWLAVSEDDYALAMMLRLVDELRNPRFRFRERHLTHMTNMT
jgi:hypothetical protein